MYFPLFAFPPLKVAALYNKLGPVQTARDHHRSLLVVLACVPRSLCSLNLKIPPCPEKNFRSAEGASTLNGFSFLRDTKGNVTFPCKTERIEKWSLYLSKFPLW